MAEEATPEETPAENVEETAPAPTAETMRADAAKLSKDAIKTQFDADKARMVELKELPAEEKTGETSAEMKILQERTGIYREAWQDLKSLESAEVVDDLVDDTPEATPEAPKAEDTPETPQAVDDGGAAGGEAIVPDQIETPDGEKIPVSANAGGNAGGNKAPLNTDVVKAQLAPFSMRGTNGANIESIGELGARLQGEIGRNDQTWVGTFNPYGTGVTAGVLGSNAEENFRTIYGDDTRRMHNIDRATGRTEAASPAERSSFTAALNCKGPAQVIQDIPFCFSQGRPLTDSGLISMFEAVNGQIQLYGCSDLPEMEGLMQEAADCEDCATCPELVCAKHQCIEPNDPLEPNAKITCMCIPESLRFSAPFLLERALEDFAIVNDIAYETMWLEQLRALSIIREIDGAALPEHGGMNTIARTLQTIKGRLALDPRGNCGGLENYAAFIPGGEAMFCAAQMDKLSRVIGCECPGEDTLSMLDDMLGGNIVFGLDQDPNGPQVAEGFIDVWDDDTVNAPAPLEAPVDAGSIYLIPRDSIGTASPLQVAMGIDDRDKCEVASGCLKLVRREWWFDLFQVGCRKPIVLDFKALGTCGTGPDLTPCS